MENCHNNAMVLKQGLENTGRFKILSKDIGVPVVAFSLKDRSKYTEFMVSEHLRRFGWIVPAYTMPADAKHVALLRVVIREDFSRTLAERLVFDITKVLEELDKHSHCTSPTSVLKKSEEEVKKEVVTHWENMTVANKANKTNILHDCCSAVEVLAIKL